MVLKRTVTVLVLGVRRTTSKLIEVALSFCEYTPGLNSTTTSAREVSVIMVLICGLWVVGCGLWGVVCGVWCVVCGVWCVVCGVWCVVCGVWCVVCGVWCVVCGVGERRRGE